MARPRPAGQWDTQYLAPALASRALNADDDHGREHGLVIRADELRWPELQALADIAKPVLDFDRHMTTNAVHSDCRQCTAIQAYRLGRQHLRLLLSDDPRPHGIRVRRR